MDNARKLLAIGESARTAVIARCPWNDTNIWLVEGQAYDFRVPEDASWTDWFIDCGAGGYVSTGWRFHLKPFESWRRAPGEPWFALIGAIDHAKESQFLIGAGRRIQVSRTGQLSCFANDIPAMYWNNKGGVELTVTRMI